MSRLFLFLALGFMASSSAKAQRQSLNSGSAMAITVGRLEATFNGERGRCTGTLVGHRLVLTANHCIPMRWGGLDTSERVTFTPYVVNGRAPYGARAIKAIRAWTGGWTKPASHTSGRDWAILLLESHPHSRTYGNHGYSEVSAARIVPGTVVTPVGYAVDYDNGDTASYHPACNVTNLTGNGTFAMNCNLYHGASGGPIIGAVWNGRRYVKRIIGVNTGGVTGDIERLLAILLTKQAYTSVGVGAGNFIHKLNSVRRIYQR